MNDFVIHFMGIVMFVASSGTGPGDARMAVVPSQTSTSTHLGKQVHRHVAYIAFPRTNASWDWNNEQPKDYPRKNGWVYFDLAKYTLSVNAVGPALAVQNSHQIMIPAIKEYCQSFVYDETKSAAAFVPINIGELSGLVNDEMAAFSDWKLRVAGNLIITATPQSGSPRSITLPPGSDVIIGNHTPEYIATGHDPTGPLGHNHFYIYYNYDKKQNTCTGKPSDKQKSKDSDIDCSNSHYP